MRFSIVSDDFAVLILADLRFSVSLHCDLSRTAFSLCFRLIVT